MPSILTDFSPWHLSCLFIVCLLLLTCKLHGDKGFVFDDLYSECLEQFLAHCRHSVSIRWTDGRVHRQVDRYMDG